MLLSSCTLHFILESYIMGFPNYLVLGSSEKEISVGEKFYTFLKPKHSNKVCFLTYQASHSDQLFLNLPPHNMARTAVLEVSC